MWTHNMHALTRQANSAKWISYTKIIWFAKFATCRPTEFQWPFKSVSAYGKVNLCCKCKHVPKTKRSEAVVIGNFPPARGGTWREGLGGGGGGGGGNDFPYTLTSSACARQQDLSPLSVLDGLSSFAFPAISLGFLVRFLRMWPFFSPTIEEVTFRLRGL